jgi:glycosyltransferase involved in cell wall biosynthesis
MVVVKNARIPVQYGITRSKTSILDLLSARTMSDPLLRLLSDRALGEDVGKNARSLVREHFSLGSVCRKYEALYNEVANTWPWAASFS